MRNGSPRPTRPIVAREGWLFIALLAAVTGVAGYVYWAFAMPGAVLLALCVWFFRDPERPIAVGDAAVVSPADGRVMFVREVNEPLFLEGRAVMVSIFLSVFDVHINRIPIGGTIAYKEYIRGRFMAAWDQTVGEVNERSYLGIDTGRHRILVSQVAGLLARRIITRPSRGDRVETGDRFGLIRFGSCTQVWLPLGSEVLVAAGSRVAGGETLIGRLPK